MKLLTMVIAAGLCVAFLRPASAGDVYQDNVVIILDGSGSMLARMKQAKNLTKMQAAKNALRTVVRHIPKTTNVGLIVFDVRNQRGWDYPLGPIDSNRLIRAINAPHAGGGTPLSDYIKRGADRLLQERKKQMGYGTYRLLIVTDGEANNPRLLNQYVPEILAKGITVDVIGVDMKTDHTLATRVHSYRKADDPQSLEKAISAVFAEVSVKDQSDSTDSAFDIIKPLPIELASAMIQALSKTDSTAVGAKK